MVTFEPNLLFNNLLINGAFLLVFHLPLQLLRANLVGNIVVDLMTKMIIYLSFASKSSFLVQGLLLCGLDFESVNLSETNHFKNLLIKQLFLFFISMFKEVVFDDLKLLLLVLVQKLSSLLHIKPLVVVQRVETDFWEVWWFQVNLIHLALLYVLYISQGKQAFIEFTMLRVFSSGPVGVSLKWYRINHLSTKLVSLGIHLSQLLQIILSYLWP